MDKNLYAAQRFFKDCFGAICFYNEPQDGYLALDGGRQMETLAIYFPNRLDLQDAALCSRLRAAAGDGFYQAYTGANSCLCGMSGCKIIASYSAGGRVVAVSGYGAAALKGNIDRVLDYFCGFDLGTIDTVTADIATNNGFAIKNGTGIKEIADRFLAENSLPEFTRKNGYFITPREDVVLSGTAKTIRKPDRFVVRDIVEKLFPESEVGEIAAKRQKDFEKLFDKLNKDEWHAYLRDMNVPAFDRPIDKSNMHTAVLATKYAKAA